MKKLFLSITFIVLAGSSTIAQMFPGYLIDHINYTYGNANNKQMLQIDSTIYLIRHGGLEAINTSDFSIQHNWTDYHIRKIVADTSGTFVYLKDSDFIGRYNPATGEYDDIWPDDFSNKYLVDIDAAPDGKIWALTSGQYSEVAIWNGMSWQFFSYEEFTYGYGSGIYFINSNKAMILAGNLFFEFQDGNFDSVYFNAAYFIKDWDVDEAGNLWAAAGPVLIHSFEGETEIFDSLIIPVGNDEFLHVIIGSNGHVWTAGNTNYVYEYTGTGWDVHQVYPYIHDIENLTLNEQDLPWVVAHSYDLRRLLKPEGNTWTDHIIPFMPFSNPKAVGIKNYYSSNSGYFASESGYFQINLITMDLVNFMDSTVHPFANNITCFSENDSDENYYISYGTNHGVYGIQGFDNSQLPSQHVNSICQDYGTYYIATDSGLTTFNGIFYYHFNTDNSPLPSNKITSVTTNYTNCFWSGNGNGLYVGTDKGLAIYQNAQWTVYDSTNINISDFYVTGILPSCNNDETYVSTLGNGMVRIFQNGEYELYNTTNGSFPDDSLYYVKWMSLMECGDFIVVGTRHHGFGYASSWQPEYFEFLTEYGETQIPYSASAVNGFGHSINIVSSDNCFFILTPCGSVPEPKTEQQFKWYQQSEKLTVILPEEFKGTGNIKFTDMTGRTLIETETMISSNKIDLNVEHISNGIYIFSIDNGLKKGYCKVLLTR
jgi:hypothetical protein